MFYYSIRFYTNYQAVSFTLDFFSSMFKSQMKPDKPSFRNRHKKRLPLQTTFLKP